MSTRFAFTCLAGFLAHATTTHAAVVADSLPYTGTPAWTDYTFAGTSMSLQNGATQSVLSTAANAGVWFGWGHGAVYNNTPAWAPGDPASGNQLYLEAAFSADAADWSAYLHDGSYSAGLSFAPTGCDGNAGSCYGVDGQAGVRLSHPGGGSFHALDLTVPHTYEFLLKDGLVAYRIDGVQVYAGVAGGNPAAYPLMVIGDGSGSTRTGRGSMTVHAVNFDNAPTASVSVVPVPAALPLLAGALGALSLRRRRD
ncbi:MAG: PEP-CTERM sorting domain-containing protein [Gammaproteobacteria bacterium]